MPSPSPTPVAQTSLAAKVLALLSSFGLATVVLIFFLIITLLGTLDQVENGLFASQKKYFESFLIWGVDFGKTHVPVVLPGGALLMVILFLNIVLGALRRIRKTAGKIGILISHFAMVFLLVASFVSFFFKKEGNLALFEGQVSDEFQSYHDSVIEIERTQPAAAEGRRSALVIPGEHFQDLTEGKARTFTHKSLPFELMVMNYEASAEPRRTRLDEPRKLAVDGFYLQTMPKQKEAEVNLDAAIVKVRDPKSGDEQQGIIWRGEAAPYAFRVGEETYAVRLTRRVWRLPFAVRLEKFERETHPGTERARRFTSHITKLTRTDGAGGKPQEEKKIITMNEPLREAGNVLFQASFSQNQGSGGMMLRSVFAVVRNPSDQWPLWSLIAAGVGLMIHMGGGLIVFLKRTRAKKAAPPTV